MDKERTSTSTKLKKVFIILVSIILLSGLVPIVLTIASSEPEVEESETYSTKTTVNYGTDNIDELYFDKGSK